MDFYHNWIYEYLLNTKWFVWSIVCFVLGANIFAPVIIWFLMSSRGIPIPFLGKLMNKAKQGTA